MISKTITKYLCLVFIMGLSDFVNAQNFEWAKQMGGTTYDEGTSIAVDAFGNVYTTGYFQGIIDFDPGPDTFNLTTALVYDIFISKLDSSGNFVWAKQFLGTSIDYGLSIAVDVSGNVYTTGVFQGTVDFDPGLDTFNLTSAGSGDIFISKLDASGNFVWAKQFGGNSDERGLSITVDASGNVYITGYFEGAADFDPGPGAFNLTSAGSRDIFISKLDASGNFVWAKQLGGASGDIGRSIAVDASGSVYTTGEFRATVDFDPGPGSFNLTSAGITDIFISKLDASGNFVWAKQLGGTLNDYGHSIAVDVSGNVFVTGEFRATVDFDPGPGTLNLTSAGSADIFISKLDALGNLVWTKQLGGTSNDICRSIALDTSGNVYTTGYFNGTTDFDPGLGTFNLTSAGVYDIFISKLDASGNFLWVKQMGGTSDDRGLSIALDASGNVFTTGYFEGTADFDPGTGIFNLTSAGRWDIFVHRLSHCDTIYYGIDTQTACDTYTWIDGNTYTSSINTVTYTLTNVAGCDSVVTLNLTIYPSFELIENVQICNGVIFNWRGNSYNLQGTYYDSLLTVQNCDSVYVLNLTVHPTFEFVENEQICDGDIFTWRGNSYNMQGTFYDSLLTFHNCDSVYVLNLSVNPCFEFVEEEAICDGDVYIWRGNSYTLPGTYYDSLLTVINSDSVYVLNLTIYPTFEFIENEEICDGDIFTWRGNNYTTAGTYYDSQLTIHNCDSVYVLNLTVNPSFEFVQNEEICDGDIFFWRGNSYDLPGTYYDSLLTIHNCDSVYVLNLIVHPTFEFVDNEEICDGEVFSWRGNSYDLSGTYYDSLLTVHNCDSVYVLNLTVNFLPVVSISGLDTFYCDYHSAVTLTGSPSGGTFSGQGVSGNVFDPAAAGVGAWAIVYSYTDGNTCTNTDTIIVEVSDCVGIETSQKQILKLYPNPNDGRFIIELYEESNITVINSLGAIVHRASYAAGSHSLDLSYLPSGVYLIKSESKDNVNVLRVVIHQH